MVCVTPLLPDDDVDLDSNLLHDLTELVMAGFKCWVCACNYNTGSIEQETDEDFLVAHTFVFFHISIV